MTLDWWTLALQTVNVIILIWLLQRFFWKPVSAMIAQRRAAAQEALKQAQAAHDKAKLDLAAIDKTRAGFAAEREALLTQAREQAARESAAKLAEAARQTETLVAAAKAQVEKDKAAATKAWATHSSDLAVDIAKRLAARLEGAAIQGAFLDWALKAVRDLPAATRASIAALVATTATPLDDAEQARATNLIGEAFGAPVRIVFGTDPALIAGLELRSDHLVVANSWRADLARILADLAHDK
jgi:F-type H+-transporting ATPase subunit b